MALVVFFASDIAEASQIRRISSIRSLGHQVLSYSFRRTNMNRDFVPDSQEPELLVCLWRHPGCLSRHSDRDRHYSGNAL